MVWTTRVSNSFCYPNFSEHKVSIFIKKNGRLRSLLAFYTELLHFIVSKCIPLFPKKYSSYLVFLNLLVVTLKFYLKFRRHLFRYLDQVFARNVHALCITEISGT